MSQRSCPFALRTLVAVLVALLAGCSGTLPGPPARMPRAPGEILQVPPVEQHRAQLSELEAHLAKLPQDERTEQLADWALAIALGREAAHDSGALQALSLHPLLRSPELEVLGALEYGAGRYALTSDNRVLFVLAADDARPERTLANLADRVRAELARIPQEVVVLRYRAKPGGALAVERQGSLQGSALFSAAYGYIESEVRSLDELNAFLARLGSLTYYRQQGDHLLLGGRQVSEGAPQVTLDDVAALYQGHIGSLPGLRDARGYDRELNGIDSLFKELVNAHNANVKLVNAGKSPSCEAFDRALNSLGRRFGDRATAPPIDCGAASARQVVMTHAALLDRLEPVVEQAARQLVAQIEAGVGSTPPIAGPGFSLDPLWDSQRLVADLELLKRSPDELVARARAVASAGGVSNRGSALGPSAAKSLLEAMQALGMQRVGPLDASVVAAIDSIIAAAQAGRGAAVEALPRFAQVRLEADRSKLPQGIVLARLLHFIESQDRVQCARYEGALAGTRAGNNLFYTDLLAKLWAGLDYQGSAPTKRLPGFVTMQGLPVAADASSTRLWFGARNDRITRDQALSVLHFAPVVSRVYSAASSALAPGQESVPEDGVRHVLDWWTNHFAAVAELEPQYRLQDELQKWSFLTNVLAFQDVMPELDRVPVQRGQSFGTFLSTSRPALLPAGVTLLPSSRWVGKQPGWECMDLLSSRDPTGARTIYGGVSLADLSQARVVPATVTAGAGPPPPPPDIEPGRVHLAESERAEHASWDYRELPVSRFAPKSSQEKQLFIQSKLGRDGVTTSWRADSGKGGRVELRFSDTDVTLSAKSMDHVAPQELVALAANMRVKAQISEAKVLAAKPRGPPAQIRRTQHRPSDDDPPSPLGVTMQQDWRAALSNTLPDQKSKPSPGEVRP